ncbi:hypothetical protein Bbelb_339540 [Branchiostoma belcheri]|nr:hypothetical protein Bbelb_339540 [Branchiostoma belcheri]
MELNDGKKLTTLTHGYLEVWFWVAEPWVCVSVCPDDGKKLTTLTLTHGYLEVLFWVAEPWVCVSVCPDRSGTQASPGAEEIACILADPGNSPAPRLALEPRS